MIEWITSPTVAGWVADRIDNVDGPEDFGPCQAIGFLKNREPVAGVVYYKQHRLSDNASDIFAAIAAEPQSGWANRSVLNLMFAYPFLQLDCARITVVVAEGNERSAKLAKKLGFRREGVLRRGWNGKTNALVFGMLKSECKWIMPRNHKSKELQETRVG